MSKYTTGREALADLEKRVGHLEKQVREEQESNRRLLDFYGELDVLLKKAGIKKGA